MYGELYGGVYPGAPSPPGTSGVQGGVFYSPRLQFVAFDVRVDHDYLDFYDARTVCRAARLRFTPVHHRGLFASVLAWAHAHKDDPVRIREVHVGSEELPELENNGGEGYVVRPCRRLLGSKGWSSARLKVKSERFLEVGCRAAPSRPTLTDEEEAFLAHVCAARVSSVLSKEAEEDLVMRNVKRLGTAVLRDARADFEAERGGESEVRRTAEHIAMNRACKLVAAHIRGM